jgi:hypothetical protein
MVNSSLNCLSPGSLFFLHSATGHVGFKTVAAPVPLARPGGRVLVLGRGGRGKTAGPVRLNAPKPLSLPSLKKENRGFDPTVAVVPTGSAGWGQPTGDSENYADADEDSAELQDASSQPARSNRMTERRTNLCCCDGLMSVLFKM